MLVSLDIGDALDAEFFSRLADPLFIADEDDAAVEGRPGRDG